MTCALRSAPLLGPTCRTTVPLKLPVAADVIVNQLASLDAVHVHPVSVSRFAVSWPPENPIDSAGRVHAKRHGAGDWVTSTVWPATLIDAERGDGAAFAATLYGIAASP